MMTHHEAYDIALTHLLAEASALYGLEGYAFDPIEMHEGGRNIVFQCVKDGEADRILRIIYLGQHRTNAPRVGKAMKTALQAKRRYRSGDPGVPWAPL